jgi:branched-chain amino acid transport system ATP-binding protein
VGERAPGRAVAGAAAALALRWWRNAQADRAVNERAEAALELAGLAERRHTIAGAASHGEQRQLEWP